MVWTAPKIGSSKYIWAGLSTDTKPVNAWAGQEIVETDTGNVFEWTGSSWIRTVTRGSISTHEESHRHQVVNELFHLHTGVTSTIATASDAGDTSIVLVSATGFNVGDTIQINNGVIETTFPTITVITTNTLTLDRPLDFGYDIGAVVEVVHTDLRTSIGSLASPIIHKVMPDAGQVWQIARIIITMTHAAAGTDDKFGDQTALTNGVVLRGNVGGQFGSFTNWKANEDIRLDMYDVTYSDKAGPSLFGTSARGSFSRINVTVELNGDNGDYMDVLVQDDLTGLSSFFINAQGYVEE